MKKGDPTRALKKSFLFIRRLFFLLPKAARCPLPALEKEARRGEARRDEKGQRGAGRDTQDIGTDRLVPPPTDTAGSWALGNGGEREREKRKKKKNLGQKTRDSLSLLRWNRRTDLVGERFGISLHRFSLPTASA